MSFLFQNLATLKCLIAGGGSELTEGWKCLDNSISGGSDLAEGVGIVWKLPLMGVELSGGLDLCKTIVNGC